MRTDASLWLAWGRFLRSFAFLRVYLVVLVYRDKDRQEFGSNAESSCPQGRLEAQGPGQVRGAQPGRVPVRRAVAKGPRLESGALATSFQSLGSESESPKDLNFVGV